MVRRWVRMPPFLRRRGRRATASSKPASLRDSIACGGAAFIPVSWPRSASPGFWTGWKSRWRAPFRARWRKVRRCNFWISMSGLPTAPIFRARDSARWGSGGWRLAYFIGAALGLIVFVMRMWIPESPRWLMIHGRPEEAHAIVDGIERSSTRHPDHEADEVFPKIRLKMRSHTPLGEVAHTLFTTYRQRSLVGLVLMGAQAFFYNAIFFTFALVLTDFFGIPSNDVGWYILPLAARDLPLSPPLRP